MLDVAIDLGTANTLMQIKGQGLVLNEPSVVAVDRTTGKVVAVGLEAKRMLGRSPERIQAIRPMRNGVIADVDQVDLMLREFLQRVLPKGFFRSRPRVVIGIPSGITEMERRAVGTAVLAAGAKTVFTVSEPMAAAIGVGLPVTAPKGSLIVDIGGGTTEVGVISLSHIICDTSIRVAGDEIDSTIVSLLRKEYDLLIGDGIAEGIKIQIASVRPLEQEREVDVSGRDLVSGLPKTVRIRSEEVRACIREPIQAIVAAVRKTLENTPPELSADIVDDGLVITGGGSMIRGLDTLLMDETRLPVRVDEEPFTCVVRGATMILDRWDVYRDVLNE